MANTYSTPVADIDNLDEEISTINSSGKNEGGGGTIIPDPFG